MGFECDGGGYECLSCKRRTFEIRREERRGRLYCALVAAVGIVAGVYDLWAYRTHPNPPEKPDPRIEQIDSQIEKLQEERDEIDPPEEPEPLGW